jgi:hypothetical protein
MVARPGKETSAPAGSDERATEKCPELARLRNLRGWNQCRLSEGVPTRFAPSDTFGP